MEKTLEHLKETLEDEIKKVIKKGDITPSEMESIQSAVCTIEMIKKMENGQSEGMRMNGPSHGWLAGTAPYIHMPYYTSRNDRSHGDSYNDGSYGRYNDRSYEEDSYGYYHDSYGDDMHSNRRSRSPVTGRYISRGMDDYPGRNRSYYDGYNSGHSIKDRMVARLESMMDEAQTEHERQTVSEWINRLTNN